MKRHIITVSIAILSAACAFAQNATLFNAATDAASAALGGATAAIEADAYAVSNNPAAMSFYDGKFQFGASYGSWSVKSIHFGPVGAAGFFKAGKLAVGVDFKYFMEQEYQTYSDVGAPLGTFKPSDMAVAAGISYGISDKLSVGVTGKFLSSNISDGNTKTAIGVDIMAMFKSGGLTASAGAVNLGSAVGAVKAGAAYSVAGLTATADGSYIFKGGFMASVGAQYEIAGIVIPRVGYHFGSGSYAVGSYFSAGLGLKFGKFRINGSYLFGDTLGGTYCAGLALAF